MSTRGVDGRLQADEDRDRQELPSGYVTDGANHLTKIFVDTPKSRGE